MAERAGDRQWNVDRDLVGSALPMLENLFGNNRHFRRKRPTNHPLLRR
jgi:hypothetical protein